MKKLIKKMFFMVPLFACTLLVTGCFEKDEDDDYYPSVCDDFQSEVNAFLSKTNNFNANPSRSNCASLKQSAISLMNKVKDCPGGEGATSVIKLWQDIDCSDF